MSTIIPNLDEIYKLEEPIYEYAEDAKIYEDILLHVIVQQWGYSAAYTLCHASADQRYAALQIYNSKRR